MKQDGGKQDGGKHLQLPAGGSHCWRNGPLFCEMSRQAPLWMCIAFIYLKLKGLHSLAQMFTIGLVWWWFHFSQLKPPLHSTSRQQKRTVRCYSLALDTTKQIWRGLQRMNRELAWWIWVVVKTNILYGCCVCLRRVYAVGSHIATRRHIDDCLRFYFSQIGISHIRAQLHSHSGGSSTKMEEESVERGRLQLINTFYCVCFVHLEFLYIWSGGV